MVGVAPAANVPTGFAGQHAYVAPAVDEPRAGESTQLSASAEMRSLDTTAVQDNPPIMAPPPAPSSSASPMTKRMSESPTIGKSPSFPPKKASASMSPPRPGTAPLAPRAASIPPGSAGSVAPPRSAPSVAPNAPRSNTSVSPSAPRSSASVSPPALSSDNPLARGGPGSPSTDPMARPLVQKPLVTTVAIDGKQIHGGGGVPSPLPMPASIPTPMPPSMGGTMQMSVPMLGSPPPPSMSAPPPSPMMQVPPAPLQSSPMMNAPPPQPSSPVMRPMTGPGMPMMVPQMTPPMMVPQMTPPPVAPGMNAPGFGYVQNAIMQNAASAPPVASAFGPAPNDGLHALANGRPLPPDDESAPLTYQVFTPEALPGPRSQPSRVSFPEASKSGVGLRIGLIAVAVCVVAATAILIIVGTSSDPPPKAISLAPTTGVPATNLGTPPAPSVAIPPTTTGDPPPASAAPPDPPPPTLVPAGTAKKPKPAGSGLKGVPLPPNPFGGGGGAASPSLKPPGKRK